MSCRTQTLNSQENNGTGKTAEHLLNGSNYVPMLRHHTMNNYAEWKDSSMYLLSPVKHVVHPNNIKISYLSENMTPLLKRLQSHDAHQINNFTYLHNHMASYCLRAQFRVLKQVIHTS
jgi:hypothetical protein